MALNPKEYGLDEQKVQTIEQAFSPKIEERKLLSEIYAEIIKSELTPELCKRAKETRLKLVKVRTGIAEIHKTQKAFYLAAGRFVDAWKNKETEPVEQMEAQLSEIENHYINLEKERIEKLDAQRKVECLEFTDSPVVDLGSMDDFVYASYLKGLKEEFDARKEAERKAEEKRLRQEEIKRLHEQRKNMAIPYYQFWSEFEKSLNFGEQSQGDFDAFMERNKKAKAEFDDEQLRIKAELEAEQKARIEAEKRAAAERKAKEEAEAKAKAEQERLIAIEREKQRKLKEEIEARAAAERKAKEEAEAKAKAEQKARIEAERKAKAAPDKEKLLALIAKFEAIEIPELTTEEASAIAENIKVLVSKLTGYITEKAKQL